MAGRPKGSKKIIQDARHEFEDFLRSQLKHVRKLIKSGVTKKGDELELKYAHLVLDRLFGKPKQATETKANTTVTFLNFKDVANIPKAKEIAKATEAPIPSLDDPEDE